MDHLFTPWRFDYVTREDGGKGCTLCDVGSGPAERDEAAFILHRARHNFLVLNIYPYTNGHLMVVPFAHLARLADLPAETRIEMLALAAQAESVLGEIYRPDGINMGLNLGRCAGAGIIEHLHLHVVPRWYGDTSFMTVTGGARLMPETLAESWRRLHGRFGAD
jgi:ATP adenylyltransferase